MMVFLESGGVNINHVIRWTEIKGPRDPLMLIFTDGNEATYWAEDAQRIRAALRVMQFDEVSTVGEQKDGTFAVPR